MKTRIAFLGAGNIAQAIMGGLVENGLPATDITACDPSEHCMRWAAERGINTAASNDEAIAAADVIMLCVKPNIVVPLLNDLEQDVTGKLFISVAAGITTGMMTSELPANSAVVRCMPNTPALVQCGMTALFATPATSDDQKSIAQNVLSAVGDAIWVDSEDDLDAVTAVSGSGPAYFFLLMESMINAAQRQGLSEEIAKQLVLQTALGASKMAHQSSDSPATLRQNVTSPGGTTQAAIEHFEAGGFAENVNGAVNAARQRSIELAKES